MIFQVNIKFTPKFSFSFITNHVFMWFIFLGYFSFSEIGKKLWIISNKSEDKMEENLILSPLCRNFFNLHEQINQSLQFMEVMVLFLNCLRLNKQSQITYMVIFETKSIHIKVLHLSMMLFFLHFSLYLRLEITVSSP